MNIRIYLIVEEGADRVYVCGTAYPAWYVKPKDRRAEIVAVDIPLPDVKVDRVVKLGPELVSMVGLSGCPDGCGASEEAHCWNNSDWAEDGG